MTQLYRRLLGVRFDDLPMQVRELHDLDGEATWVGKADVFRGDSALTRLLATVLGLPPEGRDQSLSVTFAARGETEIWQRAFGAKTFRSTQWADGTRLCERVGPVVLHMTLQSDRRGLGLTLVGARVLGMPLPTFMLPKIHTRESADGGRYRFEVDAMMPLLGRLVRYEGSLERAAR